MQNTIILVLAIIVFLTYIFIAGVSYSISKTFKTMPKWSFIAMLGYSCTSLVIVAYNLTPSGQVPWMALGAGLLFWVAAAADFDNPVLTPIHMIGAFGGFLLCILSFWLNYGMWWWSIIATLFIIAVYLRKRKDNPIYWSEVAAVAVGIMLGLVIKLVIDRYCPGILDYFSLKEMRCIELAEMSFL